MSECFKMLTEVVDGGAMDARANSGPLVDEYQDRRTDERERQDHSQDDDDVDVSAS